MTGVLSDEMKEKLLTNIPLRRMGDPKDVAAAVKFLATYGDKRAEAIQDFMWGLLNSRDFTMLH